jgi:hypothetical protein
MANARWRWVAVAAVAGALLGLALAASQPARYRARATFVVAPALHRSDPALRTLTQTAASLVRSRSVAQNVVAALALQESPNALASSIGVHVRSGTAVVDVSVTASNAVQSERIAQQVLTVFTGVADARLGRQGGGAAVAVWDAPGGSATALGKPYWRDVLLGAFLAALAAAAVLLAREGRSVRRRVRLARFEPYDVGGRVKLADLEAVVARAEGDRAGELRDYLDELRAYAGADGTLPATFEPVVADYFFSD